MRTSRDRDTAPAASHTPIYDLLYTEYLRAFRALPGDRTGEEHLGFTSFSYGATSAGVAASGLSSTGVAGTGSSYGSGWARSSWQPSDGWQPAYAPAPQQLPQHAFAYAGSAGGGGYEANGSGRQHQTGMHHIPAALPPAPRRGY
ncbi:MULTISPECIES: hypothetical protein [unclassified Streptomyces]|uniref:hypothetical protein n=1 Tax=unclassified Streptomyces TaxID=2593676 RepID=UPI002E375905|nr:MULTISPECIES: hypothetical protein [unclassified Streptomyces]WUC67102.1 hypothetical protein OG861_24375 [Streptomyces sp. NBC_00539]